MLSDLSSRIKRAKERLALTQEKEERFREQMAQQAAEGTGLNKVRLFMCLCPHRLPPQFSCRRLGHSYICS